MAEDVSASLSASILSAMDEGDDITLLTPQSDKSKKRKSSQSSRQKSSLENGLVPLLPPETAMDVLDELLFGSDPGNVLARDSLLATTKAREKLEEAFMQATQYTGRFLKAAVASSFVSAVVHWSPTLIFFSLL